MNDIRNRISAAIRAFEHPMAPIVLQEAHGSVDRLGKMLAGKSDREKVNEISNKLLASWPDERELNEIVKSPEFSMVLAGLLAESIIALTASLPG